MLLRIREFNNPSIALFMIPFVIDTMWEYDSTPELHLKMIIIMYDDVAALL